MKSWKILTICLGLSLLLALLIDPSNLVGITANLLVYFAVVGMALKTLWGGVKWTIHKLKKENNHAS